MNYNIPNDLMDNVEKNLRRHVENKNRKKYFYKATAAVIALLILLPTSTVTFAKYNNSIRYKQEIDLARENKNITEVNKSFKYKEVQFTIKEIVADETGIEVIYDVSDPRYSINKVSLGDKNDKEFTKESGYTGYTWGYALPDLYSDNKEKTFFIDINSNTADYMKNNPVTIKINNLIFSDKEKTGSLLHKVGSIINDNNLNVDWTLKMQMPMQQVKVIPVNKEYSLDIGTLKINFIKLSILKSTLDYSFVPKDKNIKEVKPLFSVRFGNEYITDQGCDASNFTGTQVFKSIYYKQVNDIGIKLIGVQASYGNSNLYKLDKNNLPMEFDYNGEKFRITSVKQMGEFAEYAVEYNNTNRIYSELAIAFPGESHGTLNNDSQVIQYKDQNLRNAIYSSLTKEVPNLKDLENKLGDFKKGALVTTVTTNSNSTEFKVTAVKNIMYDEDEAVIHK